MSKSNKPVYVSPQLTRLWPIGYSYVGDLTFDSAAYVARYSMKKVSGSRDDQDRLIMPDTGEVLSPEYVTMSRRPGVGTAWYKKFVGDVYPRGLRVVRDREMRPPRFYDSLYAVDDPIGYENLKFSRENVVDKSDQTMARLVVKEEVTVARLKQFPRD